MNDPSPPEKSRADSPRRKSAVKTIDKRRLLSLPTLSMASVLKAACAEWTILHPDNPADAVTSPWSLVLSAVECFLRHRFSDYDRECTDENREELHEAIQRAAVRQYPWFRAAIDPRVAAASTEGQPLILNDISHEMNEIVERRALLLQKRRLTRDRDERTKIDADLALLDRQSAIGMRLCQNARDREVHEFDRKYLVSIHNTAESRHYIFGGRSLPGNFTEPAWFHCQSCGSAVQKTKRPVDHGAGVKLMAWSCHCVSVSAPVGAKHQRSPLARDTRGSGVRNPGVF